jgi:uncharacterized RDD family membrane protein YckC
VALPVGLDALPPIPWVRAPLWRRFLAGLVDLVIAYGCIVLGSAVVFASGVLLFSIVDLTPPGFAKSPSADLLIVLVTVLITVLAAGPMIAYFTWMESSSRQATLGKLWLGLAVVGIHGRRISRRRALFRVLTKVLGMMCYGIGLLWMFFNSNRQAVHDRVVNSVVILRDGSEKVCRVDHDPPSPRALEDGGS